MTEPTFVHLRLHSEYSITDGMLRIDEAVAAARSDGMPALALTDLNNFFGLVKFYKASRGKGIKPVLGCDVWLSNDANRARPFRLLLLCASHQGYLQLCELLSRAYLENQWQGRAELRREWLPGNSSGLIALSGARQGDIGTALLAGNIAQADAYAQDWDSCFEGRFYVEIQRTGVPQDERYLHDALDLAARLALPVVATHPVQFLSEDDFKAHEARVCIAEGWVLNDKRRPKNFTPQQYFKTQAEMAELFADIPEALQNSVEIAKRCNVSLTLGKSRLPDFPTPPGMTLDDFLRAEALRGLQMRMDFLYPDPAQRAKHWPSYQERLEFENDVIVKMGFPGYFLIVADFIRWAKENGVPVGPGRGSGAGSLVAYCLGITDLDPLRYELLFERFLNPERVSMPDFDVDFCQDGRERVIRYVRDTYGAQCVSQIATFGTMASKGVLRDVGRVLDFPYGLCDKLSKLVPVEGVKPVSLKKARAMEPEFNAIIDSEEGVDELMELAERLEDLTRTVGMHAGGVLIAPGKLTDFCPLYTADGSNPVSQLDKDDVEAIGLVKFDFLGLRTLTIIDWAVKYVRQILGAPDFNIDTIPLDDAKTYDDIFKASNTTAVFQFESRGMKDTLKNAKPDCLEDLIALNALYRPGPMDFIPDFINRKHGRETVVYPHPCLEKVLANTYGIMVYQEQVMQAAQVAAGYTLGGADMLRRAMGKKKVEEMAEQRAKFVAGAAENQIEADKANEIFDVMEKFAGYGFNKSHAAAYSLVAYQTAYLKCHYPAAFMASTLTSEMDNTDKVSFFYQDVLQQGITILPPDVNSSGYRFAPTDAKTIAYGLGAIKGTGQAAIENIVDARTSGGVFRDLHDFCRRVDKRVVNRRTIEALIRGGAFDAVDDHRARLLANVEAAMTAAEQFARAANQNSLFDLVEDTPPPPMTDVPRWSVRERLREEKVSIGFYLSGHPFEEYTAEVAQFVKLKLSDLTPALLKPSGPRRGGVAVVLAGIIAGVRIQQTRRGRMAVLTLEDGSGQVEVTVFNELYDTNRAAVREDELLILRGKVSLDEYSGGMRVSSEALLTLAQARNEFAQQLRLRCDARITVEQLQQVLQPYQSGACPVMLQYRNRSAVCQLRLGDPWRVSLEDDLLRDLGNLLGDKNWRIVYPGA